MKHPITILILVGTIWAQAPNGSVYMGIGCTTIYHIDKDCDGYGVGINSADPDPLTGVDADDNDATVNTPSSVTQKYGTIANFLSTAKGYPTNRIAYVDFDNGNDTTGDGSVGNPYKTTSKIVSLAAWRDGQGGTIIIRGSPTNSGINSGVIGPASPYPLYNFDATAPNKVVVMSYPGEQVTFQRGDYPINSTGNTSTNQQRNVIYDGFRLLGLCGGSPCTPQTQESFLGHAMGGTAAINVTLKNSEIAYWAIAIEPSMGSQNLTYEGNVFHDIYEHGIYPVQNLYNATTFDCEAPWTWLPTGQNPHFDMKILNNVMHLVGNDGFDPIHLNAVMCGFTVEGNIVSSADGAAIGLQNGPAGSASHPAVIQNNLLFVDQGQGEVVIGPYGCDNNGLAMDSSQTDCVAASLQVGVIYYPNSVHDILITNNTIFTGNSQPMGCGTWRGTCPVALPGNGVQISDREFGTPDDRFIKNITFQNNAIITYSAPTGTSKYYPFMMRIHSYPETHAFRNNLLWNAYSGNPDQALFIAQVSDCTGVNSPYTNWCTGAGTGTVPTGSATAGTFNFTQWQTYLLTYNLGGNNLRADPLFTDATLSYTATTPWKFNFIPAAGSPLINAGTSSGAPSTDIRGVSRGANPSIGAYEPTVQPTFSTKFVGTVTIKGAVTVK